MLKALILENFKSVGRRQVIPLAPITLIFGANSAGKSSVLQSLLALKQTLALPESDPAIFSPRGDLVDLGSFRDLIFRHELGSVCEITPILDAKVLPVGSQQGRWLWESTDVPQGVGIRLSFDPRKRLIVPKSIPFYWDDFERPLYQLVKTTRSPDYVSHRFGRRSFYSERLSYRKGRSFNIESIDKNHPAWRSVFADIRDKQKEYVEYVRREFEKGKFLSMERMIAAESYRRSLDATSKLGENAEGTEPSLQPARDRLRSLMENYFERLSNYEESNLFEDLNKSADEYIFQVDRFLPLEYGVGQNGREPDIRSILRSSFDFMLRSKWSYHVPDFGLITAGAAQKLSVTLEQIVYLGPLREYPERYYISTGNDVQEVGKTGRMLPQLLFNSTDLVKKTNEKLEKFDIGYSLMSPKQRPRNAEDVFKLLLVDKKTGTEVSMLDVGFGVSQVLPVIVQSVLSTNKLILIEQPEIHLHPRLQAELGTLFAECIADPQANQFIIETHSEHLILRLQRLIREGKLKSSDISVIYALKQENGSRYKHLRMDTEGDFIDDWPEGFFEESYREAFAAR